MSDLARTVEALLFLSPQPVSAADLAEATEATEGQVGEAIELLREDLGEGKRGVVLREPVVNPLAAKAPHFPAKAKSIIWIFANGGPSHMDTWDYKPELQKRDGQSLASFEAITLRITVTK